MTKKCHQKFWQIETEISFQKR